MNVMTLGFKTLKKLPPAVRLKALDQVMSRVIYFNRRMGLKLQHLDHAGCQVHMPLRRSNTNHLQSMHACAIATMGEYCAGLWIAWNLGPDRYRIILKQLTVDYHYQGRKPLLGRCTPDAASLQCCSTPPIGKQELTFATKIEDSAGKLVATVNTVWQVKPWEQVSTGRAKPDATAIN